MQSSPWRFDDGRFVATHSYINLPAIVIVMIITMILVKGIQESASFNAAMVMIKVAAVIMVVVVGAFYIHKANWHPFAPYGWTGISFFGKHIAGQTNAGGEPVGMLAGAAIIFFAYIGFDSVSTHAEEAKNPQRDVPIGIIVSLIVCTVLYILVVAVLTGMVKYDKLDINAPVSLAFKSAGVGMGRGHHRSGGRGRNHLRAAGDDALRPASLPGDGARRPGLPQILRRRAPALPHTVEVDDSHRRRRDHHGRPSSDRCPPAADQHRNAASPSSSSVRPC